MPLNFQYTRIRRLQSIICMAFIVVFTIGTAGAQEKISDQAINNAVDDQLAMDPVIPASNIDVMTSDGIVKLSGFVTNILARDRAGKRAATVKGVRGIVNLITVAAPERSDEEIKLGVENALARDPATESWEIETTVTDGKVRLTGTVDSWQEKYLAGTVAKGVKGVKSIDNKIEVDFQTERSDAEIIEDIQRTLHWNAYVDDAMINVTVDQGKVKLEGVVGSFAEKILAEDVAWVSGVNTVENYLKIEWWNRDERLRKKKYITKTNAEIEGAINDTLFYDPRVNSYKIAVDVDDGYVTLRGKVDNLKAKRAAARDAESIVGVYGINNKIKVRTEKVSDDVIEANVGIALAEDPVITRHSIEVTAVDGVVYLFGDVDSSYEKNRADDVASRQPGVANVKNYLQVNEPLLTTYDPYVDEIYPGPSRPHDYGDRVTFKTDWQIRKEILDQFFWSPFVDGDQINVMVDDGNATLTGTVDTWGERQAATENALEGGALSVDNDLKVKNGPEYYLP